MISRAPFEDVAPMVSAVTDLETLGDAGPGDTGPVVSFAAALPATPRSIQEHLEHLLRDDRELLIALDCQLEQIRRELRLLNDDRILRALDGSADSSRRH